MAIAAHDGHALRPQIARWMRLDDATRRREEDPGTAAWTRVAGSRVIVHRSRFEVDVNRPRQLAVYRDPEQAWGLKVWHPKTPSDVFEQSLLRYDGFYRQLGALLDGLVWRHDCVLVLDLHTYNHRRGGPAAPPDDPEANPEINVGTGSLDRVRWGDVAEEFQCALRRFDFEGRRLDVRENVRFRGGHVPQWIHAHYPETVCALAIEVKKFFMNEWTNERDEQQYRAIGRAFRFALRRLGGPFAPA